MLSKDTLDLFAELLAGVQLPVAHPDFEENAAKVIRAKRELAEAQAAITPRDVT